MNRFDSVQAQVLLSFLTQSFKCCVFLKKLFGIIFYFKGCLVCMNRFDSVQAQVLLSFLTQSFKCCVFLKKLFGIIFYFTGCWVCMNRFESVQAQVLPIVVQLLQTVFYALRASKSTVVIQEEEVPLIPTGAFFGTLVNQKYCESSNHDLSVGFFLSSQVLQRCF